jgi:hypothetical protein
MMREVCAGILGTVVLFGILLTVPSADAAIIAHSLTGGGSQVPFSTNVGRREVPLKVYQRIASQSTHARAGNESTYVRSGGSFAEPGMGNYNSVPLGQVLDLTNGRGNSFGIYDKLARVPVPMMLGFDRYYERIPVAQHRQRISMPREYPIRTGFRRHHDEQDYPAYSFPPRMSHIDNDYDLDDGIIQDFYPNIPEPASLTLIGLAGLALLPRRRRV